jgi:hypothetical protein
MKNKLKITLLLSFVVLLSSFISTSNTKEKNLTVSTVKDMSTLNAALIHPNGKAYFFIRNNYRRYNIQTDKLEIKGTIGKDGWKGVPSNVDAAFIHPHNKKTYFFSGNLYYRYDSSRRRVDKKGIIGVDGWKGLDGPIDAVIMHPTNNSAYFFKGKKYHRYSFSKKKFDLVGTVGINGWKGVPSNINASLMHTNGKAYFFKGDHYYRYDFSKRKVDKKGVLGRDGWRGLYPRLDAIVYNLEHDKMHTFKSKTMTSVHHDIYNANPPDIITSVLVLFQNRDDKLRITYRDYNLGYNAYNGVPSNIDASFRRGDNGKYYFFKGSKYYRWNPKTKKVDKTANITEGWKGVPTNLNAVTDVTGGAYFFKGTNYYHFSFKEKKVIATGTISSKFRGMPNYPDAAASLYKTKPTASGYDDGYLFSGEVSGSGSIDDIIFFKNNISYYRLKDKRIRWKTINKKLLK